MSSEKKGSQKQLAKKRVIRIVSLVLAITMAVTTLAGLILILSQLLRG